jgi:hypothetical protein
LTVFAAFAKAQQGITTAGGDDTIEVPAICDDWCKFRDEKYGGPITQDEMMTWPAEKQTEYSMDVFQFDFACIMPSIRAYKCYDDRAEVIEIGSQHLCQEYVTSVPCDPEQCRIANFNPDTNEVEEWGCEEFYDRNEDSHGGATDKDFSHGEVKWDDEWDEGCSSMHTFESKDFKAPEG